MLSKIMKQTGSRLVFNGLRNISQKAQLRKNTNEVEIRGEFLKGKRPDLPTMLWFSDLVEPAENFKKFFTQENSKILDVRNVWMLNIRNMGQSDHHESFDMSVSKNSFLIPFSGHLQRHHEVHGQEPAHHGNNGRTRVRCKGRSCYRH